MEIQPIYKAVINSMQENEIRYEVFYDDDGFYTHFQSEYAIEFDSHESREDEMKRYESGELSFFGVVKKQVCKCCNIWSEKDSLWGISAKTPEAALKFYTEQY